MKWVVILALIMLASVRPVTAGGTSADDGYDRPFATAVIKDYLDGKIELDKAFEKLRTTKPTLLLSKDLIPGIKKDKTRLRALELAAKFKAPGLFDTVKNLYNEETEAAIAELIFATQEKKSVEFLFDKWKTIKEVGSLPFLVLQEGFQKNSVKTQILNSFIPFLKSESDERHDYAQDILRSQLDTDTNTDILKKWKELREKHVKESQVFEIGGFDFMQIADWKISATRIGFNWRLKKSGTLSLKEMPKQTKDGSFTIILHVLAVEGAGSKFEFWCAGTNGATIFYTPVFVKNDAGEYEWQLNFGNGTVAKVKAKRNEWAELKYQIDLKDKEKGERTIDVSVDGESLTANSSCGTPLEFKISTNGSEIIVGGIEFVTE